MLLALAMTTALASTNLPFVSPMFGDHMVLQRGMRNVIWGWTKPSEKVAISIGGKTLSGVASASGRWEVSFDPPAVGGPYTLKVSGPESVEFKDVLVGDVWICSGQSNMEMGLTQINNPEIVSSSTDSSLRLFMVGRQVAYAPLSTPTGQWKSCNPQTVAENGWGGFSAAGYFFGKTLRKELHVPIGLIQSAWGGTSVEAWQSSSAIKATGEFLPVLESFENRLKKGQPVLSTYNDLWLERKENGEALGFSREVVDDIGWPDIQLPGRFSGEPGVAWVRKTFELTSVSDAELFLGTIDESDSLWINGHYIGFTGFDWAWRHYSIPKAYLKEGSNTISIRVFDSRRLGGFTGKAEQMYLQLGSTRIDLAGTWKFMRTLDKSAIKDKPYDTEPNPTVPTVIYNGMILPIAPLAIKGAIWYQGESNWYRGVQYRKLLPALIKDWRTIFKQPNLPFYIVSLANYGDLPKQPGDDYWAEVREAQALTAKNVPFTGLAVTLDVGEANDIHPKNKEAVGERLAKIALAKNFGKTVEYSGPVFESIRTVGNSLRVKFSHAGGLTLRSAEVSGFAIAGADKAWHWAKARVEGYEVILTSPEVPNPVAVRYGWAANPYVTLFNGAGLPAGPFRSDTWTELSKDHH